jgi:hypothetical protein
MNKSQKKIKKVMGEFKEKKLHSGKKGPIVKSKKQAIAIALSEAGKSKKMMKASEGMLADSDRLTERDVRTATEATYSKAMREAIGSDRLTEADVKGAEAAVSDIPDPFKMKSYRQLRAQKLLDESIKDPGIYGAATKPSMLEKAKNVYKKLNSPEMRKMMGTGGVKKMYGGGSVLARGVRFGKNKPTKLF